MGWFDRVKAEIGSSRHNSRGKRLAKVGKLDGAISHFTQALEYCPDDGIVRFNRGLAYVRNNQLDKALEDFRLAIRFKPGYADSYFALATSYRVLGSAWKATACYQAYLDLMPYGEKSQVARTRLPEMGSCAADFQEKEWLQAACENHDENCEEFVRTTSATVARIIRALEMDVTDAVRKEGRDWMTQVAAAKAQEWAFAHFQAASSLYDRKKFRTAIVQLIEGLEILPYDQEAIIMLASSYALAGEPERAACLANEVRRDKLRPSGLQALGKLLTGLEEYAATDSRP